MRPAKSERNLRLANYYEAGHSLDETGRKFGVSMQAAHRILKRWFPEVLRPKNMNTKYIVNGDLA